MKIKLISIFLASLFCVTLLASCAKNNDTSSGKDVEIGSLMGYSEGLEYTVNEKNPNTCTITGVGSCQDKIIKIPPNIDGRMVTGVANGAFAVSGDEERPMPKRASRNASTREATSSSDVSIEISTDVSNGGSIFQPIVGTDSDTTAESEEAVLSALEGVVFPFTVREIGEEAFLGCENLEVITTTQAIQSIGKDAFKDTAYYNNEENWETGALYLSSYLITVDSSYTGEFTVKTGTTVIADQAFYQCVNLTSVNMAESVTYTGAFTFYGCTNLTYVNGGGELIFGAGAFDGCVSYKDFIYDFGGTTGGEGGNQQPSEEASNRYHEIDRDTFNSIKAMPKEYVSNTRFDETRGLVTYTVNEHGFHYIYTEDGETVRELYGMNDENGTIVYIRKDGMWYLSNVEMPENEYYIPRELTFDMLTMYDEEKLLYAYHDGDDTNRIELGFKSGHLEYIGYIFEDTQIKTVYSDYGFTVLPDFSNADVVPGIVLDINGEPIS